MKLTQLWVLLTAFVLISALALGNENSSQRIGFINLDRIAMDSKAGKSSLEDLKKFDTDKKEIIVNAEKNLLKAQKEIQDNSKIWSQSKQEEALRALYQSQAEYQQLLAVTQQELNSIRSQALNSIYRDVAEISKTYAQKNNYSILMNTAPPAIIYYNPNDDVTDEILKIYDASYGKKKK